MDCSALMVFADALKAFAGFAGIAEVGEAFALDPDTGEFVETDE